MGVPPPPEKYSMGLGLRSDGLRRVPSFAGGGEGEGLEEREDDAGFGGEGGVLVFAEPDDGAGSGADARAYDGSDRAGEDGSGDGS